MVSTIKCTILAKESDIGGYQTIVVKDLDNSRFGELYRMLVVFPNWESRVPEIGEIGFLNYDFVEAGKDKYYDRVDSTFKVYNFTNLIFLKFVKEQDNYSKDIII